MYHVLPPYLKFNGPCITCSSLTNLERAQGCIKYENIRIIHMYLTSSLLIDDLFLHPFIIQLWWFYDWSNMITMFCCIWCVFIIQNLHWFYISMGLLYVVCLSHAYSSPHCSWSGTSYIHQLFCECDLASSPVLGQCLRLVVTLFFPPLKRKVLISVSLITGYIVMQMWCFCLQNLWLNYFVILENHYDWTHEAFYMPECLLILVFINCTSVSGNLSNVGGLSELYITKTYT